VDRPVTTYATSLDRSAAEEDTVGLADAVWGSRSHSTAGNPDGPAGVTVLIVRADIQLRAGSGGVSVKGRSRRCDAGAERDRDRRRRNNRAQYKTVHL
jgi:hypothetical protein